MPWQDAISEGAAACSIRIEARPGSRRDAFPDGYNAWRNRIGVAVRAAANDGQANVAIVRLVAERFGIAPSEVRMQLGASDRRKTIAVAGLTRDDACRALEVAL